MEANYLHNISNSLIPLFYETPFICCELPFFCLLGILFRTENVLIFCSKQDVFES